MCAVNPFPNYSHRCYWSQSQQSQEERRHEEAPLIKSSSQVHLETVDRACIPLSISTVDMLIKILLHTSNL